MAQATSPQSLDLRVKCFKTRVFRLLFVFTLFEATQVRWTGGPSSHRDGPLCSDDCALRRAVERRTVDKP